MIEKDKLFIALALKNQILLDEIAILQERISALKKVLRKFIHEAHYRSLDGITDCDHEAEICFCTYRQALHDAECTLNDGKNRDDSF